MLSYKVPCQNWWLFYIPLHVFLLLPWADSTSIKKSTWVTKAHTTFRYSVGSVKMESLFNMIWWCLIWRGFVLNIFAVFIHILFADMTTSHVVKKEVGGWEDLVLSLYVFVLCLELDVMNIVPRYARLKGFSKNPSKFYLDHNNHYLHPRFMLCCEIKQSSCWKFVHRVIYCGSWFVLKSS